jgi:hypothetical protein
MIREQTQLTTEQTELLEKLNCLEFETGQLNRAYQLWRPYIEQGTAPEWMAAAIKITYDALIMFCLELSTILAGVPPAFSARPLPRLENGAARGFRAEPPPELLPLLPPEPDWSAPEMSAAMAPPSNGEQGWQEEESTADRSRLHNNGAARGPRLEPSPELLPVTETEPDWSEPEMQMPPAMVPPLTDEQGQQEEVVDLPPAYSATLLAQLKAAAWGIPLRQENPTAQLNAGAAWEPLAEPSQEYLPMTETEPDWSAHGMQAAIAAPSTAALGQLEEVAGAEPAGLRSLATLAEWVQGSPTSLLFFVPPGALRKIFRATAVIILILAGAATALYLVSTQRAARKLALLPIQSSEAQAPTGAVAIPNGKADFKLDPDPVVARVGKSFVLNAVLAQGSDIASVAVQIDYDPDLLKFTGATPGGFLAKTGQQVVVAQRDDPVGGVLRVSAEKAPGAPGISGEGTIFALSFQPRKKGKAIVSIVPGAHDSQGRHIETAGSQVSVKVN